MNYQLDDKVSELKLGFEVKCQTGKAMSKFPSKRRSVKYLSPLKVDS